VARYAREFAYRPYPTETPTREANRRQPRQDPRKRRSRG
jgi:hypothetical protein